MRARKAVRGSLVGRVGLAARAVRAVLVERAVPVAVAVLVAVARPASRALLVVPVA